MGLIDQMMANIYKPPKQEKQTVILPKNLTPAKAANLANQTSIAQGQLLKGEVLDLRANQILVLLENGVTVSARTEGTLNLSIGQHAGFFVIQTTEEQIMLKLAEEDTPSENPMIDKALQAAHIQKTERSISIVTELLAHQQPVNEAGIRHYLSLSAKYPELPVKDLILMELHHIPVTKENVAQFAEYQNKNASLLTQMQNLLDSISEKIAQLPSESLRQEVLQTLIQTAVDATPPSKDFSEGSQQNAITKNPPQSSDTKDTQQNAMTANLPQSSDTKDTQQNAITKNPLQNSSAEDTQQNTMTKNLPQSSGAADIRQNSRIFLHADNKTLRKELLDLFLLKPEDIAEPEKVQNYYDSFDEKLKKLEQFSRKLTESQADDSLEHNIAAPKQMRQNLSFLEAINQVFPYLQLPLRFRETPAHGELYVYEKKKSLKPSDTISALLHLELEALGTTDIFVTLAGSHVSARFSMTDKSSGDLIRTELPKLEQALSARGYTLTSEVTLQKSEEASSPSLLEQFLEEHAPGSLNRYTFDIRA